MTPRAPSRLRSEIDWFRFLRLFDAGGLTLGENSLLRSVEQSQAEKPKLGAVA
jgi:hypothetical protein